MSEQTRTTTAPPHAATLGSESATITHAPRSMLWHPVVLMGAVFTAVVFGLCYEMFRVAVPGLIGVSHWFLPPILLGLAGCVALFIEGDR